MSTWVGEQVALSTSRIRRLSRCRFTELFSTFLATITPQPLIGSAEPKETAKCGLVARIKPFPLVTLSKSFLERRRRRGVMLDSECGAAFSATAQQNCLAAWGSATSAKTVGLRALSLLWLIGALWHSCPQDSTSTTLQKQESGRFRLSPGRV